MSANLRDIDKFRFDNVGIDLNAPLKAGENILIGYNVDGMYAHSGYTKRREIQVNRNGIVRVKFNFRNLESSGTTYGRIYKNGVAVGIERTSINSTWVLYSEDIVVNKGDYIQLYVNSSNGTSHADYNNFNLYASINYTTCIINLE